MKIYYKVDRIMSDGEIVIVGRIYKDDVMPAELDRQMNGHLAAHGETVYCQEKHTHEKACAQKLLSSVEEAMANYFKAWDAMPEDPDHVAMPKKEVVQKVDGKDKKVQVDDRDL